MEYTVFALDFHNEVLGDHLLVSCEDLASAISALVAFWEARQATKLLSAYTAKSTRVRCATVTAGSLCHGSRVSR